MNIPELHQQRSDSTSDAAINMSDMNTVAQGTTELPPAIPPFDPTTDVLGTRCAHGHTYGSTGRSLRNRKAASWTHFLF